MPSSQPPVADAAPDDPLVTDYDLQHMVTYWRLIAAQGQGADWRKTAKEVLGRDAEKDELGARRTWESHLSRAHWLYEQLDGAGFASSHAHGPLPLQPPVADRAPDGPRLTKYDWHHFVTYWRLLDAEADGADWREVAKIVLFLDPDIDEARAHTAWESHLERAHWMTRSGWRQI